MAAGYDLKEGRYIRSELLEKDIKDVFSAFFNKGSKKESTYKFAMFKSILDNLDMANSKTYKISFDQLYARFSEIYWVLVFKHRIPQKKYSMNNPKTIAEKIVENIAEKYRIRKKTAFSDLPGNAQRDMTLEMKKKCSRYVIGALYTDTNRIFYSFSKSKEWIKLNPDVVKYIRRHRIAIEKQNYQAWAKYYINEVFDGQGDVSYYERLLKRELGHYSGITISPRVEPDSILDESIPKYGIRNLYDLELARKAKKILAKYSDVGLYLGQFAELVGCDKERLKEILEYSFWCRREGKRYYYMQISNEEIVMDALLQIDLKDQDLVNIDKDDGKETDEERIKMLDDPENLIRHLKKAAHEKLLDSNSNGKDVPVKKENTLDKNQIRNRKWDREEVVILVTEYFRSKSCSLEEIDLAQQNVSDFLRHREEMITGKPVEDTFRNLAGIRLQSGRIRCLDPDTKYSGMKGTVLQKEIVQEYLSNPQKILTEADTIKQKYGGYKLSIR